MATEPLSVGASELALDDWLERKSKSDLSDARGTTYLAFRAALRPVWWRVWTELTLAYVAFVAISMGGHLALQGWPDGWWLIVPVAAIAYGYWMAYLQLFIHEAAHFNIAPSRRWNDLIANAFIGSWVAANIQDYRFIHWEHHRSHGETNDAERSYFSALDWRFVLETLFGVKALRVMLSRNATISNATNSGGFQNRARRLPTIATAAVLHVAVIAALFVWSSWLLSVAWVLGIGMFLPFFGALRQLLEHRGAHARKKINYQLVRHGKTTRMFREGLFATTFGGAGFTRHALHHWDPQVSYTKLHEVEAFLSRCEGGADFSRRKTTYVRAAWQLLNQ